jgi:hypothetical protein
MILLALTLLIQFSNPFDRTTPSGVAQVAGLILLIPWLGVLVDGKKAKWSVVPLTAWLAFEELVLGGLCGCALVLMLGWTWVGTAGVVGYCALYLVGLASLLTLFFARWFPEWLFPIRGRWLHRGLAGLALGLLFLTGPGPWALVGAWMWLGVLAGLVVTACCAFYLWSAAVYVGGSADR